MGFGHFKERLNLAAKQEAEDASRIQEQKEEQSAEQYDETVQGAAAEKKTAFNVKGVSINQ